jgi:hypothetical protein
MKRFIVPFFIRRSVPSSAARKQPVKLCDFSPKIWTL